MHSVRLEPTKLIFIGTRTTFQATGDAGVLTLYLVVALHRGLCTIPHEFLYKGCGYDCCCIPYPRFSEQTRPERFSHLSTRQVFGLSGSAGQTTLV